MSGSLGLAALRTVVEPGDRTDTLQVHYARLDLSDEVVSPLHATLTTDERERAQRFATPLLERRFVTGRGLLRLVLAEALGSSPGAIRFTYGAYGKPAVAAPRSGGALQFNVSHSADRALIALARGRPLGVDLERVKPLADLGRIAARFFAPAEVRDLRALPAEERLAAFYTCWTRKEAYIKALGDGLAGLPLDAFEVTVSPGATPRLRAHHRDPAEPARWTMLDLSDRLPEPGFRAALVVARPTVDG
jgi:4'-phosphopantetheinyl transferase